MKSFTAFFWWICVISLQFISCAHGFLRKEVSNSGLQENLAIEVVFNSGDMVKGRLIYSDPNTLSLERYTVKWLGNTYATVIEDTIVVQTKEVNRIYLISAVPQSQNYRQWFAGLLLASSLIFIVLGISSMAGYP